MKKKALLVGSSYSSIDLLILLKKLGYDVTVCGKYKDDPCHLYGDHSIYVDYSNKDQLLDAVKSKSFDCVIPTCNDYSYLSSAVIANELGLIGYDKNTICSALHNKEKFKNLLCKYNYPTPKKIKKKDLKHNAFNGAFLVKPTDAFSGKGISKVTNLIDLNTAIISAKKHSRTNSYIIEEFVSGTLHSISVFIRGGKIVQSFFIDEFCNTYKFQVDCSHASVHVPLNLKNKILTCISDFISNLSLCDGLLHVQFISNGKQFWIIECMRRCPGDLFYKMIKLSSGIDYIRLYLNGFIGHPDSKFSPHTKPRHILRHTITVDKRQGFQSLVNASVTYKNLLFFPLKRSGDILNKSPKDKAGILFLDFKNKANLIDYCTSIKNNVEANKFVI